MDKFSNFNSEDTYGNPEYNGYSGNDAYNDPDYTGYSEDDTYVAPNYEGVRLMDMAANNNSYGTPELNNIPYNPSQFGEQEYSETGYTTSGYNNSDYSNTNYDNSEYNNQAYDNNGYNAPTYTNSTDNGLSFENLEYNDIAQNTGAQYNSDDPLFAPLYPEGYAPVTNPDSVFRPTIKNSDTNTDELTEAELADIKRQKAAARRKKMAARERRRRERRKQAIIRCSILLAIVILLIIGLVMLISGITNHFKEKKKERELSEYYATSEITTAEPVADIDEAITAKEIPTDRDAALAILQEQAEDDSTMQSICDSAAAMPDILLQHLAVNSELRDFTLSYPAMINIVFDGEFEVEVEEGEVPLYLQFDKRWGYADYSEDIIGLRGAGPTALSMAYTYLKADGSKNPIKVADYATEMGYLDENGKTHWTLMTEGAEGIGLKSTEIDVNKEGMIDALEDGKLLICKVHKGDFTTDEHFIVIRDYKDGFFYINDPNSTARSEVGWDFKRLRGQIDNMCALEAGTSEISTESSEESDTTTDNDSAAGAADNGQEDDTPANNEDLTPAQ